MTGFTRPVAISPRFTWSQERRYAAYRASRPWVQRSAIHAASSIELAAVGSGPRCASLITANRRGASLMGILGGR